MEFLPRGHTLEAVVTRMKTISKTIKSKSISPDGAGDIVGSQDDNAGGGGRIRFMAVSATVPNAEDVAEWLAGPEEDGVHYKFGEERRPVQLRKIVIGYPTNRVSDFKFEFNLTYKGPDLRHTTFEDRGILIFFLTLCPCSLSHAE